MSVKVDPMRKNLGRLSKSDLVSVSDFACRSLSVRTNEEMEILLRGVADLVPATGIVAGIPANDPRGVRVLESKRFVNGGFSESWLSLYVERGLHLVDPVFRKHFGDYRTQIWTRTYRTVSRKEEKEFIELSRDFGLDDGMTIGHRPPSWAAGSCFSFSGSDIPRHDRHMLLLECLLPHLHAALSGLFPAASFSGIRLSEREREVLSWKKEGRTAREISRSMNISERTVSFHLRNAMRKLGARNSAQAMATALSEGLID